MTYFFKLLFALVILFFSICQETSGQDLKFKVGTPFTIDTIYNIKGEPVLALDSLQDKAIILNFWMIGCRGCVEEMPYLNRIFLKYKSDEIAFFSVTINNMGQVQSFMEEHPIDWPILRDVDFHGLTGYKAFEITCMPTTLVIDKEKVVQYAQCAPLINNKYAYFFLKALDQVK